MNLILLGSTHEYLLNALVITCRLALLKTNDEMFLKMTTSNIGDKLYYAHAIHF